jgi:hypothetical protein
MLIAQLGDKFMSIKIQHITLATVTTIATLINTVGIGFANPLIKNISSQQVHQIDRGQITNIKLNPTTTHGEVEVKFGKYASQGSLQCKDLSVVIYSDEKQPTPPPKPGEFAVQGQPIFSVSRKLSGNLNSGKCKYSIAVDTKHIGKKAWLDFIGGGNYNDGAKSITIPSQVTQKDTKVVFGNIG